MNERLLIERAIALDRLSQVQLSQKILKVISDICRKFGKNKETTKDLMQDVLIKVFKVLPYFRFDGSFEGWVKIIARNHCIDHSRRSKLQPEQVDFELLDPNLAVDDCIMDRIDSPGFISYLRQHLPMGYRLIIELDSEGFNHKDIAAKLGIKESTSRSQLFRARIASMKLYYKYHGIPLTGKETTEELLSNITYR